MMKSSDASVSSIREGNVEGKGKGLTTPPMVASSSKAVKPNLSGGLKRGLAIIDFVLRLIGIAAALAATTIMGTTNETLPFFTQFIQFKASYNDLPAFTFFVIANGAASGYLVLSLPFSIISIVRPHTVQARLILLIFDTIMVVLTTAGASAAAGIVYLAHKGNTSANWIAICQQFNGFCERISGAVVASFIATVIFVLLVMFASVALRRH